MELKNNDKNATKVLMTLNTCHVSQIVSLKVCIVFIQLFFSQIR